MKSKSQYPKEVFVEVLMTLSAEERERLDNLPDGISSEDWQKINDYCKSMKMPNRRIRQLCLDPYGYTAGAQIQPSQLEEIHLRIEAATTFSVGDTVQIFGCHYHHYIKGQHVEGKNDSKTGEIAAVHEYAKFKHREKNEGVFYSVAVGQEVHCYQPGQLVKVKQPKKLATATSTTSTTLDRFEVKQGGLFDA